MWTRAELKNRAKDIMKTAYWKVFIVSLIAMVLGALSNSSGANSDSIITDRSDSTSYHFSIGFGPANQLPLFSIKGDVPDSISDTKWEYASTNQRFLYILAEKGISIVFFLLHSIFFWAVLIGGILFSIFVSNVIRVGFCRYLMILQQTGEAPPASTLFWGFRCGHYMNLVKTIFLRNLYISLWSLLFIIPGTVKTYEYFAITYILAENPEMDSSDVFALSREITNNQKWDIFVLNLSFIGWYFLGSLLIIGSLFIVPYAELTYAELYGVFRDKYPELRGFAYEGWNT